MYWEYYKVATEPVPGVEDSLVHHQLLRYNIGQLSCLVKVKVHGTVQEMPTSTGPSEMQQPRNFHGVGVIKAGQGVHPTSAFQAIARSLDAPTASDAKRLTALTARLWLSGQTRLGIAGVVPADRAEELGGLTVLDMAKLVSKYDKINQWGLRRFVGLLEALRHAVREIGAPCVGTFVSAPRTVKGTGATRNYSIQLRGAGSNEAPILLDSHKEHFWSQEKVPREQARPRGKDMKGQPQPQGTANAEHVDTPKGFIRKWIGWLGF